MGKEAGQELGEHQSVPNQVLWRLQTHVTGDSADGVGREDIQGIIISKGELELGGKVTDRTGHNTEEDGSGCEGKRVTHERHVVQSLVFTYESQQIQMQG